MTKKAIYDAKAAALAFIFAGEKIESALAEALAASALLVVGQAKKNWNTGSFPNVRTGVLRGSIAHRLRRDGEGIIAEVGSRVEYGYWVEFGTSRSRPHPFLTPALESNKSAINALINRAIRKGANDAGR